MPLFSSVVIVFLQMLPVVRGHNGVNGDTTLNDGRSKSPSIESKCCNGSSDFIWKAKLSIKRDLPTQVLKEKRTCTDSGSQLFIIILGGWLLGHIKFLAKSTFARLAIVRAGA